MYGKQQLPFVFCKRITANLRLFSANGKWKFVFLGRQTINGNRCFLFQQTCPSMLVTTNVTSNVVETILQYILSVVGIACHVEALYKMKVKGTKTLTFKY